MNHGHATRGARSNFFVSCSDPRSIKSMNSNDFGFLFVSMVVLIVFECQLEVESSGINSKGGK